MHRLCAFALAALIAFTASPADAQNSDNKDAPKLDTSRGDAMIAAYFAHETKKLEAQALADIETLADWEAKRGELRRQLFEMLSLDPLPPRTPLRAKVTGQVKHDDGFLVEKLHFQSRPGLYVTANLYIPTDRKADEKLPTILYVCGHGPARKDGVSYGNKATYQHHGAWFARHGYVCLTIDTIHLGEIEGIHHGTYRYDMWWWNNRGYTSAGVEAWNCIRALDYLETRPEVDMKRVGVTGRSGGGAYSWWIAALDDRIAAAVPVAGITDLRNHTFAGGAGRYSDGVVEGHCDCMYMVNTYRWDYATVAALVAPRPLLISNSDKDVIFPLDGVVRLHAKVKRIYDLYDAGDKLGLQITEGPHKDTQELRVHAFRWFNRWLKNDDSLIRTPAEKLFDIEQLKAFDEIPADQKNTKIQESFTEVAGEPSLPATPREAKLQVDEWMTVLREKVFRGWPEAGEPLDLKKAFDVTKRGVRFRAYDFTSQGPVRLRLYVANRAESGDDTTILLGVMNEKMWRDFVATVRVAFADQMAGEVNVEPDTDTFSSVRRFLNEEGTTLAWVAPRGVGPTAWDQSKFKQTQHRRRFMLLGQTWHGMQTFDIVRAAKAVRAIDDLRDKPLRLYGEDVMAGNLLYASLFMPKVERLSVWKLPTSHRDGPIYLNVSRYLGVEQALAMALMRCERVQLEESGADWPFASNWANKFDRNLMINSEPASPSR